MYGKRRYSKGRTTRRSSYRTRTSARRTYKKVGRSFVRKPRFAMTGFARNIEKKFNDRLFEGGSLRYSTGDEQYAIRSNGFMWTSTNWYDTSFKGKIPSRVEVSNDLVKGLETGTTARTRIGNKVKGCWIKGTITFTAARNVGIGSQGEAIKSQNGEVFVDDDVLSEENYLRTTFRMAIVKDNQVNSTQTHIAWDEVFGGNDKANGVHSQQNIDNMGRFTIIEDRKFELYANKPQKTLDFTIPGTAIGSVRYNGPSENALTDRGIYIIWAAYTVGAQYNDTSVMNLAGPTGYSRFCFTDE